MFPPSNISNHNPFDFLLKRPSPLSHQNPCSKQQDDQPPFFSNFPSPFFDEHESPLNQILAQTHTISMAANHVETYDMDHLTKKEPKKARASTSKIDGKDASSVGAKAAPPRRRITGGIPRKRTGKKDRHSKICTAQGIRDRRMRLSLQVARKFFDLQDMLGYDKASKTIEWLFTKSKKAIKELARDHPHISTGDAKSESFISECEVVSGIEELSNNEILGGLVPSTLDPHEKSDGKGKKLDLKANYMRSESRDKARERARSRTMVKMMIKGYTNPSLEGNNDEGSKLGHFSSSSPFEDVDQESRSHNQEGISPYSCEFNSIGQETTSLDEGTIEKLIGNSSRTHNRAPAYHHYTDLVSGCIDSNAHFMGFLGNLEFFTTDRNSTLGQLPVMNHVSLAGNPNSNYSLAQNFQVFHE